MQHYGLQLTFVSSILSKWLVKTPLVCLIWLRESRTPVVDLKEKHQSETAFLSRNALQYLMKEGESTQIVSNFRETEMRDPVDLVDSPGSSAQLSFFLSFWQLGLCIFLEEA